MNSKNFILPLSIFFLMTGFTANATTTVSGGIYSNTTWTLANSPYVVIDTVVVFPNVILTIEPGVIVRFQNNKLLEIRGGQLNAIGTATDSIIFTSLSLTPTPGIWNAVIIGASNYFSTFTYCNFYYASKGVDDCGNQTIVSHSNFVNNVDGISSTNCAGSLLVDSCSFLGNTTGIIVTGGGTISNSVFRLNHTGIAAQSSYTIANCTINSNQRGIICGDDDHVTDCVIDSNSIDGIELLAGNSSVKHCEIKYNNVGINTGTLVYGGIGITNNIITDNSTGILTGYISNFYCNKISNNHVYDLQCNSSYGFSAAYNDWGTTDSATISVAIDDGYDNISLGLVNFMPPDTAQCYLYGSNCAAHFSLYPDPLIPHNWIAVNQATGFSQLRYSWTWGDGTFSHDTTATPSHLYNTPGYYAICQTITDLTGCVSRYCDSSVYLSRATTGSSMVTVNVILTTGVSYPESAGLEFSVYPNPVHGTLTIAKNNIEPAEFIMEDITGRAVLQRFFNGSATINTEQLRRGIYFYEVRTRLSVIKKGKIIKD